MTIAELLSGMDAAAVTFDEALYGVSDDLMESAPDGGWTIKDIVGHIAAWNEYMIDVLDGGGGIDAFGVPESVMGGGGDDPLNEALVVRWAGMSIDEVWRRFSLSRSLIRERIASLDPDLLAQPFDRFAPDSPVADESPLGGWLEGAVVAHVADHLPRIRMLVDRLSADASVAREIARLDRVHAELAALVENRLGHDAGIVDEDGWTVADNLMHLAAWDRELLALLRGEHVNVAVGVPEDVWRRGDETEINAAIMQANRGCGAAEAWRNLEQTVADLRVALGGMRDEDLHRPRADFDPGCDWMGDLPLLRWVWSCCELHPRGHMNGIRRLLDR